MNTHHRVKLICFFIFYHIIIIAHYRKPPDLELDRLLFRIIFYDNIIIAEVKLRLYNIHSTYQHEYIPLYICI